MQVFTPTDVAKHAANKYLSVLIAAKFARVLNEFPRDRSLHEKKLTTRALDVLPDTPKNRAFIAAVKANVLKYQNTGVRIEDDYIITEKGLERISLVPREIDEIEALMKRRRTIQPD